MQDALSQTFTALADPTRRAILAKLALEDATVNELAEPFDITVQAVSRHLKVLEASGLISRGRRAQWRPCTLQTKPLQAVDDWLGRYRQHWEGSFDKLAAYTETLPRKESDDDGS